MADTLPNIVIPPNVWVDIYNAASIAVGTQILVQNVGVCDIFLAAQATQPTLKDRYNIIERSQCAINDAGDTGAWAYCTSGGLINVRLP